MQLRCKHGIAAVVMAIVGMAEAAMAFENALVLPKGVRNIDVRSVNTDINQSTDRNGTRQPLASPLMQDLTFDRIAKDQSPLKANQLKAFLASNGTDTGTSVGQFSADLRGHLSVVAPIMAYGITEKFTLALAVPYYSASTSVSVGFQPNANARSFLSSLAESKNNQTAAAREAASDLNNAVGKLNNKLRDHGFAQLQDWHDQGIGDVTLAGKYQNVNNAYLAVASTPGVVAPTGRVKDPDILTDVAFGNGVWAPFYMLAVDEKLPWAFKINEYGKYTAQLPGKKTVRAITDDEKIDADHVNSRFKLGDIVNGGVSLQWEPRWGMVTGVGYGYQRKFADQYKDVSDETHMALVRDTEQVAHNAEFKIGYSTVPLYQDGHFAAPLAMELTYVRQLRSRNMPITDLAQFDLNLYF